MLRGIRRSPVVASALSLILALVVSTSVFETSGAGNAAQGALFGERIVAGGEDVAATVRHIRLKGSNEAIGRSLAEIARTRHGVELRAGEPSLRNRVNKSYIAELSPPLAARMRGIAAEYGLDFDDDRYSFYALSYNLGLGGCSVVYYPPTSTVDGRGVMSRNYDFSTGTIVGRWPLQGQRGATSEPYVVELYPDEGYASIYLCAYDLLGGTLDGMNSEGLVVALAADDETSASGRIERPRELQIGLTELKIARHLLDTCKDVDEAKAALLSAKHHYAFVPCHYIVADRSGRSFIWEYSYSKNQEFVIDGEGPQVLTNHLVHRYPNAEMPQGNSFDRMRRMTAEIGEARGRIDREFMTACNRGVSPTARSGSSEWAPGRTLWHALYYPDQLAVEVDFYLGEADGQGGEAAIRRSGYLRFALDPELLAVLAEREG